MSSPAISDSSLIQHVGVGDVRAFEQIYDRHAPSLFGMLSLMLGPERKAEDVLKSGFRKVCEDARAFDAKRRTALAWLVSVFRSLALERSSRLDGPVSLTYDPAGTSVNAVEPSLASAWQRLSDDQRRLIDHAFLRGQMPDGESPSEAQSEAAMKASLLSGVALLLGNELNHDSIHSEHRELAVFSAFGILNEADQSVFEIEVARNTELENLCDRLTETIASLVTLVSRVQPPAYIKKDLLTDVRRQALARQTPAQTVKSARYLLTVAWGLAALLAVGCFWLWTEHQQLAKQVAAMTEVEAEARKQLITVLDEREVLEEKLAESARKLAALVADPKSAR